MGNDDLISLSDDSIKPVSLNPQPVPVPVPAPKPLADDPIAIVGGDDEPLAATQKHSTARSLGMDHKADFKRPMNNTGAGATRCRIFHSKISEGPLLHMECIINDWIDDEAIDVKQVCQAIGVLEGKRAEPNLLLTVWY